MKCSPNYFCSSCVNSRLNLLKVNEITTDLPPLLETRVMKAFDTLSPNIFLDCVGFFCLQSSKCHIETNLRNKFIKTIFTIKQSKIFYFYHVINCESSSSRSYHKIWLPVCIQSWKSTFNCSPFSFSKSKQSKIASKNLLQLTEIFQSSCYI